MKLSLDISLDADREKALTEIDLRIGRLLAERAAMSAVYTQKSGLAWRIVSGEPVPDWFQAEASSKGVSVEDLCKSIIDKSQQDAAVTLSFEALRQTLKAQVRSATSQQEITNAVLQAGGPI